MSKRQLYSYLWAVSALSLNERHPSRPRLGEQQQYQRKIAARCTPAKSHTLLGDKVTLPRAHPARGQAANVANENCDAGVHAPIKHAA